MAAEDEATSKKKVLRKEYGTAATTKRGMKIKVPAKRTPMSKARAFTHVPETSDPKEATTEGKKRKEMLGNVAEIQNFLRITKINLWRF